MSWKNPTPGGKEGIACYLLSACAEKSSEIGRGGEKPLSPVVT